jgi:hypothetical protein
MSDTAEHIRPTWPEVVFWSVAVFFAPGALVAALFGYALVSGIFLGVAGGALVLAMILASIRLVVRR